MESRQKYWDFQYECQRMKKIVTYLLSLFVVHVVLSLQDVRAQIMILDTVNFEGMIVINYESGRIYLITDEQLKKKNIFNFKCKDFYTRIEKGLYENYMETADCKRLFRHCNIDLNNVPIAPVDPVNGLIDLFENKDGCHFSIGLFHGRILKVRYEIEFLKLHMMPKSYDVLEGKDYYVASTFIGI